MSGNVYLNGRIVPREEAVLSVNDRAVLFGDAAYETMRSYSERFFRFPEHLARLRRTLAGMKLSLDVSDAEITRAALDLVRANDVPDARLRLTVTGGTHDGVIRLRRSGAPNLILTAEPLSPPPDAAYRDGVSIVVSRWIVPMSSPLARIKAANRLLHLMAKEEALERGAWDAVFCDEKGHVLEGTNTNVFFVVEGTLRTASLEEPILAGVTRDAVLEEARAGGLPVREGRVTPEDVARASEAFLTSTTIELLPVRHVDDRTLPGTERPVWRDLSHRFRRAVERETGVPRGDIPGA